VDDQRSTGREESVDLAPFSQAPVSPATVEGAYRAFVGLAEAEGWLDLLWHPAASAFREGRLFGDVENWSPLSADDLAPFSEFPAGSGDLPVLYEPSRLASAGEAAWLGIANHFARLAADERLHAP
jgi:hypothetical protein